jgi:hypothetical protein
MVEEGTVAIRGRLRVMFATLTWILFILFLSVGYTSR